MNGAPGSGEIKERTGDVNGDVNESGLREEEEEEEQVEKKKGGEAREREPSERNYRRWMVIEVEQHRGAAVLLISVSQIEPPGC